jgi:hypothetical protein
MRSFGFADVHNRGVTWIVSVALAGIVLVAAACAGRLHLPERPFGAGPYVVRGRVTYAFRPRGIHGFGVVPALAPARFVHVCAIDEDDEVVAVGYTDANGEFTLRLHQNRPVGLQIATISHVGGNDVRVFYAPPEPNPYLLRRARVVPARPERAVPIELQAGMEGVQSAGAFHVLDQLLRGATALREAAGRRVPPVVAYWYLGNGGRHADNSAYSSESAVVPGAFAITILGGSSAQPEATDADHFDADVILHELGHVVADQLGPGGSIGGDHGGDDRRVLPVLAFFEGFATFFSCAVRADRTYRDVRGLEPRGGSSREDLEGSLRRSRGIDTEASVQELLWDIADGTGGLPDLDHDGLAIGLRGVLQVLGSMRQHGDVGYIGAFLERMVEQRLATDIQVASLLLRPREQGIRWPLRGNDRWPPVLTPPETVLGEIDGRGDGGTSFNDVAAVHAFRVDLRAPAELEVELSIEGSGNVDDASDLDLELLDVRFEQLQRSATENSHESISVDLQPGTYILLVRDGSPNTWSSRRNHGNHARYELRVALD